ncbi:hypothetical protein LIER_27272 [Lithospermum erythrorhizon]|uniref:Helitron helicase-like domain-containing protein n=1 Tax=Lithospermum erythrorhizon TaxID=34254 RepID=A0AAV3RDG0_LITER
MSGKLFGQVASVVHVEFQKRGLPHAHFLIILKPSYKYLSPEAYNRIVSAELPDKNVKNSLFAAFSVKMDKPTMLLPQVHYDTRHWTVRITVTKEIATLTCNTGMRLKRYIFTDDEVQYTFNLFL